MPQLTPDFKEFLKLLNAEKIEYLLIGGYAVAVHGYVRYTDDIDFWVATSAENLQRFREVLIRFGFPAASIPQPLFTDTIHALRMGRRPNRLEVFSQIPGVQFLEAYQRRQVVMADSQTPVNVISFEDLMANKQACGRPKDLGDVDELSRAKARRAKSRRQES